MILEEILGDAVFSITRDGKTVTLKQGDEFTDAEYSTRTVYGDTGKVVIRIDQNCTIEIGAQAAPVVEITAAPTPAKTKTTTAPVETPAAE